MKTLQEAVNVLQKRELADRAERRKAVLRKLSAWECRQECIEELKRLAGDVIADRWATTDRPGPLVAVV